MIESIREEPIGSFFPTEFQIEKSSTIVNQRDDIPVTVNQAEAQTSEFTDAGLAFPTETSLTSVTVQQPQRSSGSLYDSLYEPSSGFRKSRNISRYQEWKLQFTKEKFVLRQHIPYRQKDANPWLYTLSNEKSAAKPQISTGSRPILACAQVKDTIKTGSQRLAEFRKHLQLLQMHQENPYTQLSKDQSENDQMAFSRKSRPNVWSAKTTEHKQRRELCEDNGKINSYRHALLQMAIEVNYDPQQMEAHARMPKPFRDTFKEDSLNWKVYKPPNFNLTLLPYLPPKKDVWTK